MTVVDTPLLIDILRSVPAALEWWESVETPVASEITRTELLRGMRSHERSTTSALMGQLEWQVLDDDVSRLAGHFGRTFRHGHAGIGVADLCIAATAELRGLPLATLNVRHFPMFVGLRPPY